jgi:hypothetical protein
MTEVLEQRWPNMETTLAEMDAVDAAYDKNKALEEWQVALVAVIDQAVENVPVVERGAFCKALTELYQLRSREH